ncbi:MAG TPA: chalcone isomerase family protein [Steroidobacteraceae bacterium]|nr:chalcone isomerase family protein [Steroidobacteraceae bacterium]
MKVQSLWVGAALGLLAGTALAAQCRGVGFPATVTVAGTTLRLNGLGVRKATFLKINVYVAGLYVAHPTHDARALLAADGPSELVLKFVRGVGARDIRDGFSEGFAKSAGAAHTALAARIAELEGWLGDISTGGAMTFVHIPDAGVEVSIDGRAKGVIPGEDFARALMAIWIGAVPPNPELKRGLLGGDCS